MRGPWSRTPDRADARFSGFVYGRNTCPDLASGPVALTRIAHPAMRKSIPTSSPEQHFSYLTMGQMAFAGTESPPPARPAPSLAASQPIWDMLNPMAPVLKEKLTLRSGQGAHVLITYSGDLSVQEVNLNHILLMTRITLRTKIAMTAPKYLAPAHIPPQVRHNHSMDAQLSVCALRWGAIMTVWPAARRRTRAAHERGPFWCSLSLLLPR